MENKVVENLKKELRDAEVINQVREQAKEIVLCPECKKRRTKDETK